MKRVLAAALILLGSGGCVHYALGPADEKALRTDAQIGLADYKREPDAPDPYARAVYCLSNDRLAANGKELVDAGALIDCHPKPPVKPPPMPTVCVAGYQCIGAHCWCEWDVDAGF